MISSIHWHWWDYPSPLHLRCCRRCGECNASWLLWLFHGWVAACMKLLCWIDTELGYVAGQDWDCVDAQGHYQGQGGPWKLGFCTSDTIFTSIYWHSLLAFHSTYEWQPFCHFIFSRNKSWWLRQEVFAHDELASVRHLIISSFFLPAKITNSFTLMTSTCIAYSSVLRIHTTTFSYWQITFLLILSFFISTNITLSKHN
jgi:hypothetical protein